jgi:hypothetical protein
MKIDLRTIREEARPEVQKRAAIVNALYNGYEANKTGQNWRAWTHADSELHDLVQENRKGRE